MHVADYVSSDCVDSVDECSDDQRSLAREEEEAEEIVPLEGSDDDDDQQMPDERAAMDRTAFTSTGIQVTMSKSDGHIYRCEQLDSSTTSLNRQTQCCMSFKTQPKSSRKKSQSHSCVLV